MLDVILPSLNPSRILLILIAALSFYWLWTKTRRSYTLYNIPPFPEPPKFIVGHLLSLKGQLRENFKKWRERVGDIFSLDFAGTHAIIICGYDVLKEVLVKHADKIPDIQPLAFPQKVFKEENKGIILASGANWKEQRKVSLSILRTFGLGKNLLANEAEKEVAVYIEKLSSLGGKPANVKMLTTVSVSNIICGVIIGERFEHDDPYFVRFMGDLNDIAKLTTAAQLLSMFPFLCYLPGDMFNGRRFAKAGHQINELFSKAYIRRIKQTFNENEEPTNFITAYLRELKKKQDSGEPTLMDEENLVAIIRNLFAAGTETISTTILWCLLYMLYNPDVQEKVYKEIVAQVGTERVPNMHDKSSLTYLNAVIMETQRLASVVPIAIRRKVCVPFEVRGYTFPKGSIVMPYLDSVLHDKKPWGDPENFRPERFLDEDGKLLHVEEFIPFSIGRRACLGENLAMMEIFLFLSAIFQRFKCEPADDSGVLPTMKEVVGITSMPQPFEMRFTERA